jgi:hypothetical protein
VRSVGGRPPPGHGHPWAEDLLHHGDWLDRQCLHFAPGPSHAWARLGRLYETYHDQSYKAAEIDADLQESLNDPAIRDRRGVYEYLLSGKTDPRLLNVRIFEPTAKKAAYNRQTEKAKANGTSNCPLCAHGDNPNKERIYKANEMEADHVTAWSKGGTSTLDNCEMLCVTHNRSKGNRWPTHHVALPQQFARFTLKKQIVPRFCTDSQGGVGR